MLIGIAGTRRMGRPDSAVARGARFAAAGLPVRADRRRMGGRIFQLTRNRKYAKMIIISVT
jgi:hypothetical protein